MACFNKLKQLKDKVKDKSKNILFDWQNLCHRVTDVMSTNL